MKPVFIQFDDELLSHTQHYDAFFTDWDGYDSEKEYLKNLKRSEKLNQRGRYTKSKPRRF